MQLGVPTMIAIYLTVWWTVLFAVLPLGARSHAEAGVETTDGGDPGAPVVHNMKRKALTTTWVAAVVWVVVVVIAEILLRRWAAR
jgi:predicted secreted protein